MVILPHTYFEEHPQAMRRDAKTQLSGEKQLFMLI
jgi:hypothetical protein